MRRCVDFGPRYIFRSPLQARKNPGPGRAGISGGDNFGKPDLGRKAKASPARQKDPIPPSRHIGGTDTYKRGPAPSWATGNGLPGAGQRAGQGLDLGPQVWTGGERPPGMRLSAPPTGTPRCPIAPWHHRSLGGARPRPLDHYHSTLPVQDVTRSWHGPGSGLVRVRVLPVNWMAATDYGFRNDDHKSYGVNILTHH